jgi:hypothetical protein
LLRNGRLLATFHNLRRPHAVDKHTGKHSCGRVHNAHLRSLRDALLVTTIFLGDILRGLDAERFSQRISP